MLYLHRNVYMWCLAMVGPFLGSRPFGRSKGSKWGLLPTHTHKQWQRLHCLKRRKMRWWTGLAQDKCSPSMSSAAMHPSPPASAFCSVLCLYIYLNLRNIIFLKKHFEGAHFSCHHLRGPRTFPLLTCLFVLRTAGWRRLRCRHEKGHPCRPREEGGNAPRPLL